MGQFDHLPEHVREIAERQARAHDFAHMRQEEITRKIESFIVNADDDTLHTVHHMLNRIAGSFEGENFVLAHLMGQMYAVSTLIRGMCLNCGDRHGAERCPLDIAAEQAQSGQGMVPFPVPTDPVDDDLLSDDRRKELYDEYNVLPLAESLEDERVQCQGCGVVYVSLEDRMVKDPDDCHGCHLKSAHG